MSYGQFVSEGVSDYTLADLFSELKPIVPDKVDDADILRAEKSGKTTGNSPVLKGLYKEWTDGRYDEDPDLLVQALKRLV